ncbi:GDP-mannose 4,6-dehydratase [Shewanella violacea]|uniref:GDP-mannose 4,6-dehydratase n=1 Tax=Shewanella violacea (strain JCM 10179 / CIP 106290 / LMG 19151 / DSS12) TaxID=637905 RepID=D4ZIE9_SHEVD|nr:GDP-mannose 4,6-dehydratase [Shewanella violacea]BAJ01448.1 GDP-mannose 4,6-dehydratase [Shewanella violacea DSS12]
MLKALITGINGQDGAYLCKLLLSKGYKVYGIGKGNAKSVSRLKLLNVHEHPNLVLLSCDISHYELIRQLLAEIEPDEIYNFAAYSFVADSHNNPLLLHMVTASTPIFFAEAIRSLRLKSKFFQASSSEIFGDSYESPQTEKTLLQPRNPYGLAKSYAHQMLDTYRSLHSMFIVTGILYNHESPLRDNRFVTRKITSTVAEIAKGNETILEIGNLDSVRDWGFAEEYVFGIWSAMQHKISDEYIFSTGIESSVRDFITLSFSSTGVRVYWRGEGINEVGVDENEKLLVRVNKDFYREKEKTNLIGDSSKAKNKLGWQSTVTLQELCKLMVDFDLK